MDFFNHKIMGTSNNEIITAPENLVFSGGGIKGIAYSGALKALKEKGLLNNIKRVAGASAGAITASLIAIGMSPEEITTQMNTVDFASFLQKSNVNIEKLADEPHSLLDPITAAKFIYDEVEHRGLCDGSGFINWLVKMFNSKGFNELTTFRQLYNSTNKELSTVICNINHGKSIIANHINTPDMPVVKAVRASMSIPFVFQPVEWNGDLYVDGGTMYNYPIEVFDNECPQNKTLGFILSASSEVLSPSRRDDNNIIQHAGCFFNAIMNVSYEYCFRLGNQFRTVFIDTTGVKMLDFSLSPQQKATLINNGYNAAIEYLKI